MARRFESRVFFPWERKRGLLGFVGRARAKIVLFAVAAVVAIVVIHRREEHAAGVRSTRASITSASRAVGSYRADHAGKCPTDLVEVVRSGYARELPHDAWGHPLRLECPSRRPASEHIDFDLSSDGPDGIYGGLDRVQ